MTDENIDKLIKFQDEVVKKERKVKELEKTMHVNHILHLLLSIVTGGMWLIVWLFISMSASSHGSLLRKANDELAAAKRKEHKLYYKGVI
jgi:sensor c-di-GMP phosphodiesterase-like protein